MTGVPWWSQAAGSNANSDPTINWAEGQAPSSVNDSARAMMASTAKWRDDIAGAIITTGTSSAYSVTSNQQFDSLTRLAGQVIAFTPHTTNTTWGVTLNVDGLGVKALRTSPSVDVLPGTLIQGTPYSAVYNSTDGVFYLHGFFGNLYNIPLGAGLDYWGFSAPNSFFAFPAGQAISRTTYATLFSLLGTQYGGGDGSTTFNLPDKRGRASACVDNMGGTFANRITTTVNSNSNLGGFGGAEASVLAQANLPAVNFSVSTGSVTSAVVSNGSLSVNSTVADVVRSAFGTTSSTAATGGSLGQFASSSGNQVATITSTGTVSGQTVSGQTVSGQTAASGGSASTFTNLQPTILCNYIIRVI